MLSEAELREINAAIDRRYQPPHSNSTLRYVYEDVDGQLDMEGEGGEPGSRLIAAMGGGVLGWEEDRELFRRLNCHPTICRYLNGLLGAGFRMDHPPSLRIYTPLEDGAEPSMSGFGLHGSSGPGWDPHQHYIVRDGTIHNGLTVVAWQFEDIGPGDGGFVRPPPRLPTNRAWPLTALTGWLLLPCRV